LDLLREGPRTTGQLSREFPELSRFAVMQHLNVLEESGIVLPRREGRMRLNHLNPIPLREVYERWIGARASSAAESALRLKRYAETHKEEHPSMDLNSYRHVQIELELRIQAPRPRVFAALTSEVGEWWPHRYKPDSTVYCDARAGGEVGETFANGGGAIYGKIVYFDPPYKLASSGPSSLGTGLSMYTIDTLEEEGEETVIKRSMRIWGSVPDDAEQMYRQGSKAIMERALREYLVEGKGYEVPA
jgi:DNA-binding transcriptional ArsR family regulator/uncharacterized protein YndB with AHSA1/START domain